MSRGVNWQSINGENGYSNTSISHTYYSTDGNYFETKSQKHLLKNLSTENQIKIRKIHYLKTGNSHSLDFGLEASYSFNKFDFIYEKWQDSYGNITPELRINKNFNNVKGALFANFQFQPVERLKLNIGFREDYFTYNKRGTFAPRFSASYALTDGFSVNGSAGTFYQNIPEQHINSK